MAEEKSNFADIVEKIEKLSVLELSQLVKELEEKFGVSASAPMMVAAASGTAAGAAPAEAAEEKTNFSVVLTNAGAQKIAVIKAIREVLPNLGLVEAKEMVEGAPKEIMANAKKEEAEAAKAKLEAAGASIELK